jgi:AraC-like DNA-binding protein
MDYSDIYNYNKFMTKQLPTKWISSPNLKLWADNALYRRSVDLTPLYIHRYVGPRNNQIFTSHDFWEMTYVFHGRGSLQCRDCYNLRNNVVILIPPNTDHYEFCQEPLDTLWLGLKGRRLRSLDRTRILFGEFSELDFVFERLWLTSERSNGLIGPELDALTSLALSRFVRLATESPQGNSPCIDEAIQWMHRHFDQPLNVSDLAYRFGYSEGYFYRIFKKQTGQTPIAFLTNTRIQHAVQVMKNTTLTLDRIARLVGYDDPLYFSRVFRNIVGCSPRKFRRTS